MSSGVKLNLACGKDIRKDFVNIDGKKFNGVDKVCDLNKGIPFKPNSVACIVCNHFLEHVKDKCLFLKECNRVLKTGGILEMELPHKSGTIAYHVCHLHFFSISSFSKEVLKEEYVIEEIGKWKVLQNDIGISYGFRNSLLDRLINLNIYTKLFFECFPFVNRLNVKLQKI